MSLSNRLFSSQTLLEREQLWRDYQATRQVTETICKPLEIEDYVIQTMPEASPAKWHLAHVTWFFEAFLLKPYLPNYKEFNQGFHFIFNSYYQQLGVMHPRAKRGCLSRPTVAEIYQYRAYVDEQMQQLIDKIGEQPEIQKRILIGLNHEQQHQELFFTDIKYNLSANPLYPVYRDDLTPVPQVSASTQQWHNFDAGMYQIGNNAENEYIFDNEYPAHQQYVDAFQLSSRLVTNGEYIEFIEDNGYQRPEFWLADAWTTIQQQQWQAPLYWEKRDEQWWHFTLAGLQPVDKNAPVCHVSYFEADAFASWAGARLPTEFEWEVAAQSLPLTGNFYEADYLQPTPAAADSNGLQQMYGDVWEWTRSPYVAYPKYRPAKGAIGEYNGKFMCNQFVLRGGSCATSENHIRLTYRNFFYPHERWQFKGFRLAQDV
ncbi:ergothioneine biosynthesis protein EgtB [Candidatus Albibeggiatoa sp. nov. NOAA]|uniref:ergothioneine biosynthesis protein EgtB n=1 Tax=Candidatus Albibeggiatoa sp. nov. NOAA TaxID=3162724 RepID=UPI0032F9021C|nr:ergothioneine biosynthesis protein EgtB [Thiotrichaceae bacterium]